MKKKTKRVNKHSLEEVNLALLALFADLDMVFTEDDALSPSKRKISLGRCYEGWKRCRTIIDPEFNPTDHQRPPRFGTVRVGLSQGSSRRATR